MATVSTPKSGVRSLSARVGTSVRALREHHGLTQVELADRSGLTAAAVSQIEHGKRMNNLESLHVLATALELEGLSELFKIIEICADEKALGAYLDEFVESLDELFEEA
ncbi:MAG: helix-turn-helix transcriptional regulator [Candidatus Hydrogenedentota bacterium]